MPRDVGVVVVAAGKGTRLGGEVLKQYRPLAGVPVVLRALRPFTSHPDVAQVVLVLPAAEAGAPPAFLADLRGPDLTLVAGGEERGDSVAAVPLSDTVKEADEEEPSRIARTVSRDRLWRAQTPQGFPRALLERAHAHARRHRVSATDDAALVESCGGVVRLVPDSQRNLKITTAEDFALAELLAHPPG